jgi:hypothetical protein
MKNQKKKNKSKLAEFWDGLGLVLGVIYFLPVLLWESISDRLKKKERPEKKERRKETPTKAYPVRLLRVR